MRILKIDKVMLMSQLNKKTENKKETVEQLAVKRDELELSEKAKKLQQEREGEFRLTGDKMDQREPRESVKRAKILPFKKSRQVASRYSVGTE